MGLHTEQGTDGADLLIVQTAIAGNTQSQSWLAMTKTHLLLCFHVKFTNYILDLSQSREQIIQRNAGVYLHRAQPLGQKCT